MLASEDFQWRHRLQLRLANRVIFVLFNIKQVAFNHLLVMVLAIALVCDLRADEPTPFRVAGYLPEYRFADFDAQSFDGLSDLIIFSAEPTSEGGLDLIRLQDCPWQTLLSYKTQHRVRLFLTIGGWDRSENFAQMAKSSTLRKAFAEAVLQCALEKRLDGIDIDWEHPADAEESNAYGDLLTDIRTALKPHGLMLTVTIAAWQHLPASAINAVDYIQVMAYDHDEKHSTLDGAHRDMSTLIDAGIPPSKIVLGLPFYGRDVQTRQPKTYREIVAESVPDPGTDQIGSVYFNGPETIRRKVEFAIDSKLGGLMVWELGQDASGDRSLLRVIRNCVSSAAQ